MSLFGFLAINRQMLFRQRLFSYFKKNVLLQFGEYFGAVLCAEDLNRDGFTDLLVGAPLHSGFYPDEGRVYVYMGSKNMVTTVVFYEERVSVEFYLK